MTNNTRLELDQRVQALEDLSLDEKISLTTLLSSSNKIVPEIYLSRFEEGPATAVKYLRDLLQRTGGRKRSSSTSSSDDESAQKTSKGVHVSPGKKRAFAAHISMACDKREQLLTFADQASRHGLACAGSAASSAEQAQGNSPGEAGCSSDSSGQPTPAWPTPTGQRDPLSNLGHLEVSLFANSACIHQLQIPSMIPVKVAHDQLQGMGVVGTASFQTTKDACISLLMAKGLLVPAKLQTAAPSTSFNYQLTGARGAGKSICLCMTAIDMMLTCERSSLLKGKVRILALPSQAQLAAAMTEGTGTYLQDCLLLAHAAEDELSQSLCQEIMACRSFVDLTRWIVERPGDQTILVMFDGQPDPAQTSPGTTANSIASWLTNLASRHPVLSCLSPSAVEAAPSYRGGTASSAAYSRLEDQLSPESFHTVLSFYNFTGISQRLKDTFDFLSGRLPLLVTHFCWTLRLHLEELGLCGQPGAEEGHFEEKLAHWGEEAMVGEIMATLRLWAEDQVAKAHGARSLANLLCGGVQDVPSTCCHQPLLTIDEVKFEARLTIGLGKQVVTAVLLAAGHNRWATSPAFMEVMKELHKSKDQQACLGWMVEAVVLACRFSKDQAWTSSPELENFKEPRGVCDDEPAAVAFLPTQPNYPHVDLVFRESKFPSGKNPGPDKPVAVAVQGEQITLSPAPHQASRELFMHKNIAGKWAKADTTLTRPISATYTFCWIAPACKHPRRRQPKIWKATSNTLEHTELWLSFKDISDKLEFLDS